MSLANQLAVASSKISALTVEATEFPELAQRFDVQGVPRTVVNGKDALVGALPERQFVDSVLAAAGIPPGPDGQQPEGG